MKKRALIAAIAAGLLALALAGGAIMAQFNGDGDGERKGFPARVAVILGLAEADVQSAMKQAREDMANEKIDEYLSKLVEGGVLTQDQAAAYRAWIDAKPARPEKGETVDLEQLKADYLAWLESRPDDLPGIGPGKLGNDHRGGFRHGGRGKPGRGGFDHGGWHEDKDGGDKDGEEEDGEEEDGDSDSGEATAA